MKTISLVIPVYNNQETIEELLKRIESSLLNDFKYEVIFVNDQSTDSSLTLLKKLNSIHQCVTVIDVESNVGQQKATLIGIQNSSYDYIVTLDADLENNPKDIGKLIHELDKGYDVVYALNSSEENRKLLRRFGSMQRDMVFKLLANLPRDLKVCSFRVINREIADQLKTIDKNFVYLSMEILAKTDKVSNIKVDYGNSIDSGYTFKKLVSLYLKIIGHYSFLRKFLSKNELTKYQVIRGSSNE